jgi:hypothetical protein
MPGAERAPMNPYSGCPPLGARQPVFALVFARVPWATANRVMARSRERRRLGRPTHLDLAPGVGVPLRLSAPTWLVGPPRCTCCSTGRRPEAALRRPCPGPGLAAPPQT